jgi:hypothetical protein
MVPASMDKLIDNTTYKKFLQAVMATINSCEERIVRSFPLLLFGIKGNNVTVSAVASQKASSVTADLGIDFVRSSLFPDESDLEKGNIVTVLFGLENGNATEGKLQIAIVRGIGENSHGAQLSFNVIKEDSGYVAELVEFTSKEKMVKAASEAQAMTSV